MTVKKVLLFSLIGLVIAAIVIGGIMFFVLRSKDNKANKKIEYYQYTLSELYTNIKDSNRILKANITIEYTDENLQDILDKNKAKITNDILEYFRGKTFEELSGQNGQQNSRDGILSKVKEITTGDDISNVYFTEFIIQ